MLLNILTRIDGCLYVKEAQYSGKLFLNILFILLLNFQLQFLLMFAKSSWVRKIPKKRQYSSFEKIILMEILLYSQLSFYTFINKILRFKRLSSKFCSETNSQTYSNFIHGRLVKGTRGVFRK